jgi:hypothetical protein
MSRKSSINKIKRSNAASKDIESGLIMDLYLKGHSPITSHFQGQRFAECDVLSVTKSDYICEYEIKISKSDFKADFKKEKHTLITERVFNETVTLKKVGKKTFEIKNPYYAPNYFYFVVTENLVTLDEVPEYAGLIYVKENGSFETIKKAPLLHKTKASPEFIRGLAHQLSCKLIFKKVQ